MLTSLLLPLTPNVPKLLLPTPSLPSVALVGAAIGAPADCESGVAVPVAEAALLMFKNFLRVASDEKLEERRYASFARSSVYAL